MSARVLLQQAVLAALSEAGVAAFDAAPLRRAVPFAVVEDPVLAALDAAGVTGRVGTIAVTATDAGAGGGERPVTLRETIGAIEAAVIAMPRDLPDGWRIAGLRLSKSRIARGKSEAWSGTSEFQVRLFRIES
jgi:hypothetical protein